MGFTYDACDDNVDLDNEEANQKIDAWCLKNPDYELMVYRKKRRLERQYHTGEGVEEHK